MAGSVQRRFFFSAVLLALVIITVSLFWQVPTTQRVSSGSLMTMMDAGETPTIIDVRSKFEYNKGHIPSALNLSLFLLFSEHDELALSQKSDVIVYCNTGLRARVASFFLRRVGFESIYVLEGQLNYWKRQGYPIIEAA